MGPDLDQLDRWVRGLSVAHPAATRNTTGNQIHTREKCIMPINTVIEYFHEDDLPKPPVGKWPGRGVGEASKRWLEIVKILESRPTATGGFCIAIFPCFIDGTNNTTKAHGDASNIVQHMKKENKNAYIAVRRSAHNFECWSVRWHDQRLPVENTQTDEIRVYARALPLEEAITMPEFGDG
jgi:hypothetical protein